MVGKIYCVDRFMLEVYFEARCVVKGCCVEAEIYCVARFILRFYCLPRYVVKGSCVVAEVFIVWLYICLWYNVKQDLWKRVVVWWPRFIV